MTAKKITLAYASDLHVDSTMGLCPGGGVDLDGGGHYDLSPGQEWLWQCWTDFNSRIRRAARGRRVYGVLGGDIVDGDHHGTLQLVTANITEQRRHAVEVVRPFIELCDVKFVLRGTDAHAGESSQDDEDVAAAIGAEATPTGESSWYELRLDLGGVLVDCAHHCSAGNRAWTAGSAAVRIATEAVLYAAAHGERPPDLVLRSHVHRYHDSGDMVRPTRCIISPAWQLRTAFAYRKALQPADIGGIIVQIADGEIESVEVARYSPPAGPRWRERPVLAARGRHIHDG